MDPLQNAQPNTNGNGTPAEPTLSQEANPAKTPAQSIHEAAQKVKLAGVRTFEGDIQEAMKKGDGSVVKIAVAEKEKRDKAQAKAATKKAPAPTEAPVEAHYADLMPKGRIIATEKVAPSQAKPAAAQEPVIHEDPVSTEPKFAVPDARYKPSAEITVEKVREVPEAEPAVSKPEQPKKVPTAPKPPAAQPVQVSTPLTAPLKPKPMPSNVVPMEAPLSEPSPASSVARNLILVLVSVLFIAGGAGGFYYVYSNKFVRGTVAPTPTNLPSYHGLIDVDKEITIDTTSTVDVPERLMKLQDENLARTQVENIYLVKSVGENKQQLSTADLFLKIGAHPPAAFSRSLLPEYMLGNYAGSSNTAFLILRSDFYQNAYSGMLNWESTIYDDIGYLFPRKAMENNPITQFSATSTSGTSTPTVEIATKNSSRPESKFTDIVIKNKDVRILRDQLKRTLLLYTFIDKETILITGNEETLREILSRVERKVYSR